jgi:hypothetical protein
VRGQQRRVQKRRVHQLPGFVPMRMQAGLHLDAQPSLVRGHRRVSAPGHHLQQRSLQQHHRQLHLQVQPGIQTRPGKQLRRLAFQIRINQTES